MQVELISQQQLVDDIYQFNFSRPSALQFDPGDYVELGLGSAGRKWLTITSGPEQPELEFITKLSEQRSDYKQALSQLQAGQTATISPAIGNFNLPPNDQRPLLWMAGGIGITPYIAMARWLRANPERNLDITLLYAAKDDQHIKLGEFSDERIKIIQLPRRPTLADLQAVPNLEDHIVYLSGPQPLCIELHQQLRDAGLPRTQLKLDYFPGYNTL